MPDKPVKEPRGDLARERGEKARRGRLIGLASGAALLLSGCAGTTITKTGHEVAGLYNIVLVMATIVFVGVEVAIIWQNVKYRRRKGHAPGLPPQVHGQRRLEIG